MKNMVNVVGEPVLKKNGLLIYTNALINDKKYKIGDSIKVKTTGKNDKEQESISKIICILYDKINNNVKLLVTWYYKYNDLNKEAKSTITDLCDDAMYESLHHQIYISDHMDIIPFESLICSISILENAYKKELFCKYKYNIKTNTFASLKRYEYEPKMILYYLNEYSKNSEKNDLIKVV